MNQYVALANRITELLYKISALQSQLVPTGTILPFGGASAPDGFLLCDGSAVSRTTYAALFAVIGTAYGAGDGSTTFNVPNGQGVGLTGAGSQDIGGRTKTGPTLGAVREDQMQQITGTFGRAYGAASGYAATGAFTDLAGSSNGRGIANVADGKPCSFDSANSPNARTGAYTHGPELGVNYIIKT